MSRWWQRQQAQSLARQLETEAQARRAAEMTAADLGADSPVPAAAPVPAAVPAQPRPAVLTTPAPVSHPHSCSRSRASTRTCCKRAGTGSRSCGGGARSRACCGFGALLRRRVLRAKLAGSSSVPLV